MLSITPLADLISTENFGEKPQSKVFQYAGQWWSVVPNSAGTSVFRLDGTSWTETQQISTNTKVHADVKLVGDLAHVLLYDGTNSQVATLQYDAVDNRFEPWALQPNLVDVQLSSGVETATLEVDSTGRMWIASDASTSIEVRYSDGLYTSWSAPITIASGISTDDISAVVTMPGNKIGVMWSDQSANLFGFRVHIDGSSATDWSADEHPAGQSALNVGSGMSDDHIHLATSTDGTLYAAVKTSYNKSGYPKIALLVRRPSGVWDNLYEVDQNGTRPVVVVDETTEKLIIAYTSTENGGDILYRESPLGAISFSPVHTMMTGSLNNVTTAKVTSTDSVVFMADSKGVLYTFDPAVPNLAPVVNAGADRSATVGTAITLSGSATDDGQPTTNPLSFQWSTISGPGTVTFGSATSASTSVGFSAAGTYVLQLAASDGQLTGTDQVTVVVSASDPGGSGSSTDKQLAFQNGLFPNVAYAGSIDTKIAAKSAKSNYGNSTKFTIDGSPDEAGLFRWDVSAIPVGATVTSVTIDLTVSTGSTDSYEVYALRRAWDELSATWQRYATGKNWSVAGASGSADQSSAVLGQLAAKNTGLYHINLNDAGVAAVQAWINDPSQNYGIIIKDYAVSKAVEIRTSEYGTASQRPKLVINYTDPPPLNLPPAVNVGTDLTAQVNMPLAIGATVSDDGRPGGAALLTALWTVQSGPTTATFGDSTAVNTNVTFSTPGIYTLRLTVSDSVLSAFDELLVTVS